MDLLSEVAPVSYLSLVTLFRHTAMAHTTILGGIVVYLPTGDKLASPTRCRVMLSRHDIDYWKQRVGVNQHLRVGVLKTSVTCDQRLASVLALSSVRYTSDRTIRGVANLRQCGDKFAGYGHKAADLVDPRNFTRIHLDMAQVIS